MTNRRTAWIGAFAFCVTIWFGILIAADVFGATPPINDLPKITGWIHVFGCPRTSPSDDTHSDVIIVFENGQVAHIKPHTFTQEQKDKLKSLLTMNGLNIQYDCGSQA